MREDDQLDSLDSDARALVAKLKELPPEGTEPDWVELEAAIRAEVGDQAPKPWWRNWRWIVPIWALATTAAIAIVVLRSDATVAPTTVVAPGHLEDAGVTEVPVPAAATTAMWLDGEAIELDDGDGELLDELDGEARQALGPEGDVTGGILPVADYGWIDALDDDAIAAAEDWLNRKRT